MKRSLVTLVAIAVLATPAAATLSPTALSNCFESTVGGDLRTKTILDGLGLARNQILELRLRLSNYYGVTGFEGLDGIGLTAAQKGEIQRRINIQVAARSAHPVGWPCAEFRNRLLVIRFVRGTLVANGFRATMTFYDNSPRQIGVRGIQDGELFVGEVVVSGVRQITIRLGHVPGVGEARLASEGGTFSVDFDP